MKKKSNPISEYCLEELQYMVRRYRNNIESIEPFELKVIEEEITVRTFKDRWVDEAYTLLKKGFGDALIQGRMYASRENVESIDHIVMAIGKAKARLALEEIMA